MRLCLTSATSAPAADPSSVPLRLRGGEEEEEDPGEEGQALPAETDRSLVSFLHLLRNRDDERRSKVNSFCLCLQKSKLSTYENEEDVSVRNNNSGEFLFYFIFSV